MTGRSDAWIRWTTTTCVALLALIASTVGATRMDRHAHATFGRRDGRRDDCGRVDNAARGITGWPTRPTAAVGAARGGEHRQPGSQCRGGRANRDRAGNRSAALVALTAPPNCAFVPGLGFGPVTTSPPDLEGKRSYRLAEVQLNPMAARAEYVAALLSSPIGKRLRESVATGPTIPHTPWAALGTLRIPDPSLAVQEEAVRTAPCLASMEAAVPRSAPNAWPCEHRTAGDALLRRLTQ